MSDPTVISSPIVWQGGKTALLPVLLMLIPPHRAYVEVFGGGLALLLNKPPSMIEVVNDIDSDLINFWLVLRDRFDEFDQKLAFTPSSRELYCQPRPEDSLDRAVWFFVKCNQSYAGFRRKTSWMGAVESSGRFSSIRRLLRKIDGLPCVYDRLRRVSIENQDWSRLIPVLDGPETFFFLDPPYIETAQDYASTMSHTDHLRLFSLLTKIKGKALLCGYDSKSMRTCLPGWNIEVIGKRRGGEEKEVVLYNYPRPTEKEKR
jgi:DNA adenine methylase